MSSEQIKKIKAKNDDHFMAGLRFLGGEGEEDDEVITPDDPRFDSALASMFGCTVEELETSDKEKQKNEHRDRQYTYRQDLCRFRAPS